jgi:hypothetical protein
MRTWLVSLATITALGAGCAGITTTSNVASGADLAKYRTYGWVAPPSGHATTIAEQDLRSALEQDLAQKGLVPATNAAPDFLISYHVRVHEEVQAEPGAWGYGWAGYPDLYTYTQGTLIVDFIDPQTSKVFWRGTASSVVEHPNNPDPQKINNAVSKLINQYPTQVAGVPRPAM